MIKVLRNNINTTTNKLRDSEKNIKISLTNNVTFLIFKLGVPENF